MPYQPVPLVFTRLSEAEQHRRSVAFLETISRRRTVRDFAPDPVPHALIDNAIAGLRKAG